jgi:hypothetical protein
VRRKLGKLRRLSQSDIWQIEMLISARIAKPVPVLPQPPCCGLKIQVRPKIRDQNVPPNCKTLFGWLAAFDEDGNG